MAGSGPEAASPVANTVLSCQNSRRASDLEFRVAVVGSHCPREDGVLSTAAGACRLLPQQQGTQAASDSEPSVRSRSTCACVEYYGKALEALVKGVQIMCIHGKMKHKRDKIFMGFRRLQRCVSCPAAHCVLPQGPHMGAVFSARNPLSPLPSYHTCSVWSRGAPSPA